MLFSVVFESCLCDLFVHGMTSFAMVNTVFNSRRFSRDVKSECFIPYFRLFKCVGVGSLAGMYFFNVYIEGQ